MLCLLEAYFGSNKQDLEIFLSDRKEIYITNSNNTFSLEINSKKNPRQELLRIENGRFLEAYDFIRLAPTTVWDWAGTRSDLTASDAKGEVIVNTPDGKQIRLPMHRRKLKDPAQLAAVKLLKKERDVQKALWTAMFIAHFGKTRTVEDMGNHILYPSGIEIENYRGHTLPALEKRSVIEGQFADYAKKACTAYRLSKSEEERDWDELTSVEKDDYISFAKKGSSISVIDLPPLFATNALTLTEYETEDTNGSPYCNIGNGKVGYTGIFTFIPIGEDFQNDLRFRARTIGGVGLAERAIYTESEPNMDLTGLVQRHIFLLNNEILKILNPLFLRGKIIACAIETETLKWKWSTPCSTLIVKIKYNEDTFILRVKNAGTLQYNWMGREKQLNALLQSIEPQILNPNRPAVPHDIDPIRPAMMGELTLAKANIILTYKVYLFEGFAAEYLYVELRPTSLSSLFNAQSYERKYTISNVWYTGCRQTFQEALDSLFIDHAGSFECMNEGDWEGGVLTILDEDSRLLDAPSPAIFVHKNYHYPRNNGFLASCYTSYGTSEFLGWADVKNEFADTNISHIINTTVCEHTGQDFGRVIRNARTEHTYGIRTQGKVYENVAVAIISSRDHKPAGDRRYIYSRTEKNDYPITTLVPLNKKTTRITVDYLMLGDTLQEYTAKFDINKAGYLPHIMEAALGGKYGNTRTFKGHQLGFKQGPFYHAEITYLG